MNEFVVCYNEEHKIIVFEPYVSHDVQSNNSWGWMHCIGEDEKESLFLFYYLIVEWKKTLFRFIKSTAKRNVHQIWQIVHQINGVVRTAFIAQIPLICYRLHWKLFTFRIYPHLMQMDEECVRMHLLLPPKPNVFANYYSFVFTALYVTDARTDYSFRFFFRWDHLLYFTIIFFTRREWWIIFNFSFI